MRLTVVANPDNRRVRLFAAAAPAGRAGRPRGWCRGAMWRPGSRWRSTRTTGCASTRRARTPRSTGCCGAPPGRHAHGEIVGLAAWYRGFADALDRVAVAVDAAGARLLTDPAEILAMFDKRACHARLTAAGVAVAPALPGIAGYARPAPGHGRGRLAPGLRQARARLVGLRRAGAAPSGDRRCGPTPRSSWSGPVEPAVQLAAGAPLPRRGRRGDHCGHTRPGRPARRAVVPQGGLDGRVVDLRVVVVAGRPTHVVVRGSRSPMTNLHLGGVRGDLDAVRRGGRDAVRRRPGHVRRGRGLLPGQPARSAST